MNALHTDLYQLTMAAGYFHRGMTDAVGTCRMFVRRLPKQRQYIMAMGLNRVLDYLENLNFSDQQVSYLKTLPQLRDAMTPEFSDYLRHDFRFTGDVWAVPEGTVTFANEPLVCIRAPIIEAQIVETFLLSVINHATLIASKAARIVDVAQGRDLIEMGSRRTHPDAAVDAARAAYCAGFTATSNVEAGFRFGVPLAGTAAHMWTMAHPSEEEAFANYLKTFPNACTLLIDTYDTLRGASRAAEIARDKLKGVRLDSGDLLALSRAVRTILDSHGCPKARIVASGDLNEYRISELLASDAPIDVFGIGTDLVTSVDAPALGGVYKLVELERDSVVTSVAKFSEGKSTLPGAHQVCRFYDSDGFIKNDVIALADEPINPAGKPLLTPVMQSGTRVMPTEPLETIRKRASSSLASLTSDLRSIHEPASSWEKLHVSVSPKLHRLTEETRIRFQEKHG